MPDTQETRARLSLDMKRFDYAEEVVVMCAPNTAVWEIGRRVAGGEAAASVHAMLGAVLREELALTRSSARASTSSRRASSRTGRWACTTEHWYPAPGLAIHRDRSRPDPLEQGREALVDLYLLGECHYLIGDTSSTFAEVATLLATAEPAHRIDVARRRAKMSPRLREPLWRAMVRTGVYSWGLRLLRRALRLTSRR